MRRPSDLTDEEALAEAKRLQSRRRAADRIAAGLFSEQAFIHTASEEELRAALPLQEAEEILAYRRRQQEDDASVTVPAVPAWLAQLIDRDGGAPITTPAWFHPSRDAQRYLRPLPVTARADTGGFAIGGEETFRVAESLRRVEAWIERRGNSVAVLLESRTSVDGIESLVVLEENAQRVFDSVSELVDADGIIRIALADVPEELSIGFVVGIRFAEGVEVAAVQVSWRP